MEGAEKSLESEKEELLRAAIERFGEDYFERLEELAKTLLIEEENNEPEYTISVNYQGAFYASKE